MRSGGQEERICSPSRSLEELRPVARTSLSTPHHGFVVLHPKLGPDAAVSFHYTIEHAFDKAKSDQNFLERRLRWQPALRLAGGVELAGLFIFVYFLFSLILYL